MRKGVVINLDATVESIKKVIEQAELMAGSPRSSRLRQHRGHPHQERQLPWVIAVSARNRVIEKEDIRRVIDAAKAVSIPPDRQILHVRPGVPWSTTRRASATLRYERRAWSQRARGHGVVHLDQNTISCPIAPGRGGKHGARQLAAAEACVTQDEKDLAWRWWISAAAP